MILEEGSGWEMGGHTFGKLLGIPVMPQLSNGCDDSHMYESACPSVGRIVVLDGIVHQ